MKKTDIQRYSTLYQKERSMNKIFLLLLGFTALYGADAHVQVSVISPAQKAMDVSINAEGIVQETDSHTINAPYDGILHLQVSNTQKIKRGEKIAFIENQELQNNLILAQSELSLYKDLFTMQQQKEENAAQMLEMGLISKNDYLTEHSLFNEKKISFLNAQTRLKSLKERLQKGTLISPITGYVTDLLSNGNHLSYGSKICSILGGKVYVRLFVPSFYISSLHIGEKVLLSVDGKNKQGIISQILPKATNNLVEVVVSTSSALQNGLHIQAKIAAKSIHGWVIPKECIVLVQNRPALYLIKEGKAHLHFVNIQKDLLNKVLITDDLHKEDNIAYENAYMLDDGIEVEIVK